MPVAAVELGNLVEVIWVATLAGVGVTALFSFVVLAGAKSAEARREGSRHGALGYTTLAVLCFVAFLAVVIIGVQIMLTK